MESWRRMNFLSFQSGTGGARCTSGWCGCVAWYWRWWRLWWCGRSVCSLSRTPSCPCLLFSSMLLNTTMTMYLLRYKKIKCVFNDNVFKNVFLHVLIFINKYLILENLYLGELVFYMAYIWKWAIITLSNPQCFLLLTKRIEFFLSDGIFSLYIVFLAW